MMPLMLPNMFGASEASGASGPTASKTRRMISLNLLHMWTEVLRPLPPRHRRVAMTVILPLLFFIVVRSLPRVARWRV